MQDNKASEADLPDGVDVHPRHESWVRIATHNNRVSLEIFLAFVALFIIVISLHPSRGALIDLAILGGLGLVLVLFWALWSTTPRRRRRFLGEAGMTARIKADLTTELWANAVHVESAKGVVTLRGTVPYPDFRDVAEELARRQGARQVVNELKIASDAPRWPDTYVEGLPGVTAPAGGPEVPSAPPLQERVLEALEDDPRVNAYVLLVRVENGMVYLTGRQDTEEASEAATEVALHVPGVLGVSNELEILPGV